MTDTRPEGAEIISIAEYYTPLSLGSGGSRTDVFKANLHGLLLTMTELFKAFEKRKKKERKDSEENCCDPIFVFPRDRLGCVTSQS